MHVVCLKSGANTKLYLPDCYNTCRSDPRVKAISVAPRDKTINPLTGEKSVTHIAKG